MGRKKILTFHVICPIIIGAVIYYLVSPDVMFVKKIDAVFGGVINIHITPTENDFLKTVRNYFPDMMWGYALVFALFYINGNNAVKTGKIFWIAFSFSAVMEMLQITPFVRGTFDILDIGVEFLAEIIAVFIINHIYLREEFEDEKENEMAVPNAVSGGVRNHGIGKRFHGFGGNKTGCYERRNGGTG